MMRYRVKFGLIVAAVVITVFIAFLAILFSSPLLKPGALQMDPVSMVFSLVGLFAVVFVVMIILALAISAIIWGQWLGAFGEEPTSDQILDERYAKGEIDHAEYSMLKNNIEIARRK
ncbi:MAG TPA: SHOCT domain-containing protein [Methanomassiliicoccales archaeon]